MLTKNLRFRQECNEFAEKISKTIDPTTKAQLNQLLNKMLSEARSIDRQHEELVTGAKLASDVVADHRSQLTRYRQQIIKKIQECERAGLIR